LLAGQPGHELANQSPFGAIAMQACKIAKSLREIRNEYGGGHGRARLPDLTDEMVALALDGGLMWSRWALRRIGYFSEGRPIPLINDLTTGTIFRSGDLKRRLLASNLSKTEPRHQRSIGVAVGQRAMQGTFVVQRDGVESCLDSDDLVVWPREYRVGLAYGLWFDLNERATLSFGSIKTVFAVLEPVPDCSADLIEWIERIIKLPLAEEFANDWNAKYNSELFLKNLRQLRPNEERPLLLKLAKHVEPGPPF
jgi:hypothetical protein